MEIGLKNFLRDIVMVILGSRLKLGFMLQWLCNRESNGGYILGTVLFEKVI